MIDFIKGQSNLVTVTLTENSTVTNPIYLFEFKNQQTSVKSYFIATDISAYKERYNQFNVVETTDPDTLQGEVSIDGDGFYDYTIYQTSLANTSGLTTAEDAVPYITKTVEVGLVWVAYPASAQTDYNPASLITHVYNPD